MESLEGKTIIVTGGTQGLGEGIARHLAQLGCAALVLCGRNRQAGEAVAAKLEAAGTPCEFVRADLCKEEDCIQVVRRCDERFGSVHGLVNAAGVTDRGTVEDTSVELWDYIFAVNARAPFILTREAVRLMKRDKAGGSIVNIITMSSYGGQPFLTPYSASKGALAVFTKNAAHSLRFDRIRVNGLNIGWMDTPGEHRVQRAMGRPENWLEIESAKQPFGRLLRPEDAVHMVALLLSDAGKMMTGSLIDFDQNVMGAYD